MVSHVSRGFTSLASLSNHLAGQWISGSSSSISGSASCNSEGWASSGASLAQNFSSGKDFVTHSPPSGVSWKITWPPAILRTSSEAPGTANVAPGLTSGGVVMRGRIAPTQRLILRYPVQFDRKVVLALANQSSYPSASFDQLTGK